MHMTPSDRLRIASAPTTIADVFWVAMPFVVAFGIWGGLAWAIR